MTTLEIILSFSLLGALVVFVIFMKIAHNMAREAYEDAAAMFDVHVFLENIIKYNIVGSDRNSIVFPKEAFRNFVERESDLYRLEFEDDAENPDNVVCWAIKNS